MTIIEDPDVMGGLPVFKGTRVLVATVLASKRAGFDMGQLREAYPFLTPELVVDAEAYLQAHPRVEHPLSADRPALNPLPRASWSAARGFPCHLGNDFQAADQTDQQGRFRIREGLAQQCSASGTTSSV